MVTVLLHVLVRQLVLPAHLPARLIHPTVLQVRQPVHQVAAIALAQAGQLAVDSQAADSQEVRQVADSQEVAHLAAAVAVAAVEDVDSVLQYCSALIFQTQL